jgi:hypothetical protein
VEEVLPGVDEEERVDAGAHVLHYQFQEPTIHHLQSQSKPDD